MSPLWLQVNDFFYSYSYHVEICHSTIIISGGFRLWRLVMYFCVNNCTSPSNDYTAVECSNNNQAQLNTHVSVSYWSPDDWLGLELLRDIQFGHLRDRKWVCQPPNFRLCFACQWLNPFSKFLNPPLIIARNFWGKNLSRIGGKYDSRGLLACATKVCHAPKFCSENFHK